jgi:hypothetical protein
MAFQINPNVAGGLAIFVGALDAVAKGNLVLPDYLPPDVVHIIIETDKFIVGWWNLFIVPMMYFLSSNKTGFLAPKPADPPAGQK